MTRTAEGPVSTFEIREKPAHVRTAVYRFIIARSQEVCFWAVIDLENFVPKLTGYRRVKEGRKGELGFQVETNTHAVYEDAAISLTVENIVPFSKSVLSKSRIAKSGMVVVTFKEIEPQRTLVQIEDPARRDYCAECCADCCGWCCGSTSTCTCNTEALRGRAEILKAFSMNGWTILKMYFDQSKILG